MFANILFLFISVQSLIWDSAIPLQSKIQRFMFIKNCFALCVVPLMAATSSQICSAESLPSEKTVFSYSDSLSMSIEDMFSRIESDNRTMSVLRSAQEAAEEGIKAAKSAGMYPELSAPTDRTY